MIIRKTGHYIVRVVSNQGVQFAHLELPEGYNTDTHPLIGEIHTGPHEDAVLAWLEHRKLRQIEP